MLPIPLFFELKLCSAGAGTQLSGELGMAAKGKKRAWEGCTLTPERVQAAVPGEGGCSRAAEGDKAQGPSVSAVLTAAQPCRQSYPGPPPRTPVPPVPVRKRRRRLGAEGRVG